MSRRTLGRIYPCSMRAGGGGGGVLLRLQKLLRGKILREKEVNKEMFLKRRQRIDRQKLRKRRRD